MRVTIDGKFFFVTNTQLFFKDIRLKSEPTRSKLFVSDRTNKLYAIIVGHVYFDEPQLLDSSSHVMRIHRLLQTSWQDSDGQLQVLREN